MNQKTLMTIGITALVVLVLAPKLRSLPLLSKLPTA
jgi:Ni/Fe-hydrogenase subunit HybB-like protein